jgi:lysophospholipase L1-like esterase
VETNRTGGIKMAFITDILNTIKNARKGKDMRQAIYDGIQQCYKDATGHPDSVAAVVERLKIEKGRIDELATSQTFTGNYTQSNLVFHAYRNATTGDPDPDDSYNYEGTSGKHEMPICKIFQEGTLDFAEKQSNEKVKILKEGLYIFELRIFISGSGKLDIEARINDVSQRYNAWQIVAQSTEETKIIAYILYLKGDDVVSFYGTPGLQASVRAPVSDVNCYVLDWIGKAQISDCSKEISDIRVGEDGAVYGTAGEAVRKQIGNITEDIDNFPFQLIKSKNEFNSESVDNQDGKTLSDVGKVIDDSNYSVSHKIKCQYGDTVYLSRRISDISDERQFVTVWNICAYDSSDKFLGISTKGSYAVPPNTDYVRFNYWTTLAKTRKIMLSLNSDITYEEYFSPYHIVEKSAIDNPVKELFKDDGIIVDRKIIMPLYGLYVMQGKSVPVFFDNIIMHGQAKNLNVFQSAKGNFLDNGVFQKSLETLEKGFYQNYVIVNSSYNTLLKKNDDVVNNSRLIVVDTNAGNGVTRKVLVIGDSITAANVWTDKLVDLFSDDVMNVEMLGTRGTSKAPNEGRGGWRAWNYAFEKDASNDGLSSSVTNPFLNPTSNKFDFSYYMNQQNYTSVDYILLCLGTNDVSRRTHNTDDDILLAWKTIIDSIKAFDDNIKILIWLLPMPCGLTNEQPKKDTFLHMKELLINKYDNMESRQTNKIYLVDVGCSVSPTDDFNYKEELISEYGEEKWKRPTDIIHPATKGYYAIAKNIHAGIKAIESGVITN